MSLRDLERDLRGRIIRTAACCGDSLSDDLWHRYIRPFFTGHVRRVWWLRRVAERWGRR